MEYFIEQDILKIGNNWANLFSLIEEITKIMNSNDCSQPIKPYLDFKNPSNRIIAMPAYVGGNMEICGIKWIASFPDNINYALPRANSVTILNSATTGVPYAVFNTTLLSIIRTTAVSGLVLKEYVKNHPQKLKVGIIGFGPIGQMHYQMLNEYFKNNVESIQIYDIRKIDKRISDISKIANIWEEAYKDMDIVITTTVSKKRYIDLKPKINSLLLNISLRDYKVSVFDYVKKGIIVDNWSEVCRKNTDIEVFHNEKGLQETEVFTIMDVINGKLFDKNIECFMFNPMGMSSYDIGVAHYFYEKLHRMGYGKKL